VEVAGRERPVEGPDQGFCLFTPALGLQAIVTDSSFEAGIRRVISYGGDTDANAAVAGALLGAREGASALPKAWLDRLIDRDEIEREAAQLIVLAARVD
jgi:ADP-ribosylglycohydrolase